MEMYIQNNRDSYIHPLDGALAHFRSIMYLAAKDIETMSDEKGAEWSGEQRLNS